MYDLETIIGLNEKAVKDYNEKHEDHLDRFWATGVCEGFIEAKDEDEVIRAWQFLIDTGHAWTLQGWFGRTAHDLIERGICHPKAS